MNIKTRAIRLAALIEGSSLLIALGEHSSVVGNVLVQWFIIVNAPAVPLFRLLGRETLGLHVYNGRMQLTPGLFLVVAVDFAFWILFWCGALLGLQKLKTNWRKRRASSGEAGTRKVL
jgi:hypothetical protein